MKTGALLTVHLFDYNIYGWLRGIALRGSIRIIGGIGL